jgi:preprotein translocase subunit YajC
MFDLISSAHAQETVPPVPATATDAAAAVAGAPSATDAFITNMGLILVMFVLFYFLLIRPQQKRLKAQQALLQSIQKGDRVLTAGGLIGKVVEIRDNNEVDIDLGKGNIVTALRYTISTKLDK